MILERSESERAGWSSGKTRFSVVEARPAELDLPARDYAIPEDLSSRLSSILNDFLSRHVRRAWLQNSRSWVFEFIGQYRELLCRLAIAYRGFVSQGRTFEPR